MARKCTGCERLTREIKKVNSFRERVTRQRRELQDLVNEYRAAAMVKLEGKDVHVIRLALAAYVCDADRMHTEHRAGEANEQQARARALIERSEQW